MTEYQKAKLNIFKNIMDDISTLTVLLASQHPDVEIRETALRKLYITLGIPKSQVATSQAPPVP